MGLLLISGLVLVALTTAVAGGIELAVRRRRAERIRQSKPGGFRRWVDSMREQARIEVTRLTDRQEGARRLAGRIATTGQTVRDALLRGRVKSLAWIAAGAAVFTGLWVLAVRTEIGVDARSFHGLGYANNLAFSLALLTTLVFCLLGIVVSDVIGLTHLLPGVGNMSATARVALVGAVVVILLGAASQLPRLAEYRSAPIAAQVREAQNALEALTLLPRSQRPPVVVSQAKTRLAAAEERLATARYVDKRLAVGAATLEAATSWAAAWSLLLVAYLLIGGVAAGANRRADAAAAAIRETNQRFYARVFRKAAELEIDPATLPGILNDGQEGTPPGGERGRTGTESRDDEPVESTPPQDSPGEAEAEQPSPESEPEPSTSWNAF